MDRLGSTLPVREEARYMAAPQGWRGRAAGLLLRLSPVALILPV
jgi:hypothetical protein